MSRGRGAPARPAAVAAGLLAALLAASPALADWRREYDLGLRAVQSGDWAAAERHMRAALREDGEPEARKRFQGMRVAVYVPHYYAGLAEFRQGNCQEALELWRHAPTRSVVQEAGLAAELGRYSGECETRLAASSKPAPAVAQQPEPARPVAPEPSQTRPQPAREPPARTVARTEPPPSRTEPVRQDPPRTQQTPAPERPTTPRAAPPALRTAVDAYLSGRDTELAALDAARIGDTRARALALMLRAASRYGQGEREKNEQALAAAREDVRAAKRAAPSLALDESLFSPRFRAFVRETR